MYRRATYGSLIFTLALLWMLPSLQSAQADDRDHQGYYYPTPQTEERYKPRVNAVAEADRRTRIAFTTGLTAQMLASPSPPRFAIFAKGDDAEKLIIVSITDGAYNTLYRLRALLAMLTAYARSSPAFNGLKTITPMPAKTLKSCSPMNGFMLPLPAEMNQQWPRCGQKTARSAACIRGGSPCKAAVKLWPAGPPSCNRHRRLPVSRHRFCPWGRTLLL